jgi:hypothetical protein
MNYSKKLSLLLRATAASIFLVLVFSCELFCGREVCLVLPEPSQFISGEDNSCRWTVRYLDAQGEICLRFVSSDSSVVINPGKMPWIIASAAPDGDFRPAGVCAPTGKSEYTLNWVDGAAASFFLSVPEMDKLVYETNIGLIAEKIREKGTPSPWCIDQQTLKIHYLAGTLNGNLYKLKSSHVLNEDLPLPSESWDKCLDFLNENGLVCIDGKNVFYFLPSPDVVTDVGEKSGLMKLIIEAGTYEWEMLKMYYDGSTDVSFGSW